MDLLEAMRQRHSVRRFDEAPLCAADAEALRTEIARCNRESGLHIQLVTGEPKAFGSFLASYGMFSGVTDYIAMVGRDDAQLEETCGYYGEQLVLRAQQLGMKSCWVALTFRKIPGAFRVDAGEKLACVIAVGYSEKFGTPHRGKRLEQVAAADPMPDWFRRGAEAALLAPTAVNQQKFHFTLVGENGVRAEAGRGIHSEMDLGIVKYHFEIGAGKENFHWQK